MGNWKDNISFILVEPKEPSNIGASARAMKNMGFRNLELVKPGIFLTDEARHIAYDVIDVLENAKIHSSFKEAIKDKAIIIGTTRRVGRSGLTHWELRMLHGLCSQVEKRIKCKRQV